MSNKKINIIDSSAVPIPIENIDNKWKKYDQDFIKYLHENNIDLNSKKNIINF